jgi:Xaa-Pro aminopeptidase
MLLADGVPDHCDIVYELSTVASLKTVKNAVEAEGIRRAHERDGAALVRFFHWLQGHVGSEPPGRTHRRRKAGDLRAQGHLYKGQSFYPIMAYQANGARATMQPAPASRRPYLPPACCSSTRAASI